MQLSPNPPHAHLIMNNHWLELWAMHRMAKICRYLSMQHRNDGMENEATRLFSRLFLLNIFVATCLLAQYTINTNKSQHSHRHSRHYLGNYMSRKALMNPYRGWQSQTQTASSEHSIDSNNLFLQILQRNFPCARCHMYSKSARKSNRNMEARENYDIWDDSGVSLKQWNNSAK